MWWAFANSWQPTSAFPAMRGRLATVAAATTILAFVTILFVSAPISWGTSQPSLPVFGQRPYKGLPNPLPWHPPSPKEVLEGTPAERLVVKVKLESESAAWLDKLRPKWQNEVVTIKRMYSNAHPQGHRPDKGRVANAYLTWIVENYNYLPATLVFLPPVDPQQQESLILPDAISDIQIPFIQSSGFANLRCPSQKSRTTCNSKALMPDKPNYELRTLEAKIPKIWETWFGNTTEVPERVATVLGAQFAVSKTQVQKRSVEDYLKYWVWLNKTIMDDDSSGLVFEYFWHVVFGKEAVFCPERARCECDVYGKCTGL